jgi:hypothetical protein
MYNEIETIVIGSKRMSITQAEMDIQLCYSHQVCLLHSSHTSHLTHLISHISSHTSHPISHISSHLTHLISHISRHDKQLQYPMNVIGYDLSGPEDNGHSFFYFSPLLNKMSEVSNVTV